MIRGAHRTLQRGVIYFSTFCLKESPAAGSSHRERERVPAGSHRESQTSNFNTDSSPPYFQLNHHILYYYSELSSGNRANSQLYQTIDHSVQVSRSSPLSLSLSLPLSSSPSPLITLKCSGSTGQGLKAHLF